jgi:serine/threonine protein kinase
METLYTKQPGTEPLPGYRLIEPLGCGGYGEVWKCEVAGGIFKAIKFVRGDLNSLAPEITAEQELAAFERMKTIRHPFILSLERAEIVDGELIIAMELADQSLEGLFKHHQCQGKPGIPRDDLLRLLADAAEALDLLSFEYGLQHLDVKPANLFVVRNHAKVADFGLVQSYNGEVATGKTYSGGFTPQYSSPEILEGEISRHSDQYSLAIVYQQMVTGALPFQACSAREMMFQHLTAEPDLKALPEADRPVVAKALAKDPHQRYSSCQEFIQALTGKGRALETSVVPIPTHTRRIPLRKTSANPDTPAGVDNTDRQPQQLFDRQQFDLGAKKMAPSPRPPTETVPGFEVLESLSTCLPLKLRKLRSADDQLFLGYLLDDGSSDSRHVEHFRNKTGQIHHEALPPQQIVQVDGRWLLLTEYLHPTLLEEAKAAGTKGKPGIPAEELIDKIGRVALTLDQLYEQYEVPHLCLHPNSIMGAEKQSWLIDFGVIPFLWLPRFGSFKGLNYRYSAPELAENNFFRSTDQYSLAILYAELLTGINPRPQPVANKRRPPKLDLTLLPSSDHEAVMTALDPDPEKRFASCSQFVEALRQRRNLVRRPLPTVSESRIVMVPSGNLAGHDVSPKTSAEALQSWKNLICERCNIKQFHSAKKVQFVERTDHSLYCHARLRYLSGFLVTKLQAFCEEWKGICSQLNAHTFVVRWLQKRSVWKRITRRLTGLELRIRLEVEDPTQTPYTGAHIDIHQFGHPSPACKQWLQAGGPKMLESLSQYLQFLPEQRNSIRLHSGTPFLVYPVLDDSTTGGAIEATAIDVSFGGVKLLVPQESSFQYFYLHFDPSLDTKERALFGTIAWKEPLAKGGYRLGASLLPLSTGSPC